MSPHLHIPGARSNRYADWAHRHIQADTFYVSASQAFPQSSAQSPSWATFKGMANVNGQSIVCFSRPFVSSVAVVTPNLQVRGRVGVTVGR